MRKKFLLALLSSAPKDRLTCRILSSWYKRWVRVRVMNKRSERKGYAESWTDVLETRQRKQKLFRIFPKLNKPFNCVTCNIKSFLASARTMKLEALLSFITKSYTFENFILFLFANHVGVKVFACDWMHNQHRKYILRSDKGQHDSVY